MGSFNEIIKRTAAEMGTYDLAVLWSAMDIEQRQAVVQHLKITRLVPDVDAGYSQLPSEARRIMQQAIELIK